MPWGNSPKANGHGTLVPCNTSNRAINKLRLNWSTLRILSLEFHFSISISVRTLSHANERS